MEKAPKPPRHRAETVIEDSRCVSIEASSFEKPTSRVSRNGE